ncbi:MAG: hypothetical protein R3C53_15430 [Pirellulaceae bacterium]
MKLQFTFAFFAIALVGSWIASTATAEDPKGTSIELADGKLMLQMPKEWKKETPKSRIVQYEFSAPVASKEEDSKDAGKPKDKAELARITIMGAGGSVKDNIERWYGQFEDAAKVKEAGKVEEFAAGGHTVHFVNLAGTFKDTAGAGPFSGAKPVLREDYRMLGGIIVTKDLGQYFIKITGPAKTVEALEDGFKTMLKELKSK